MLRWVLILFLSIPWFIIENKFNDPYLHLPQLIFVHLQTVSISSGLEIICKEVNNWCWGEFVFYLCLSRASFHYCRLYFPDLNYSLTWILSFRNFISWGAKLIPSSTPSVRRSPLFTASIIAVNLYNCDNRKKW